MYQQIASSELLTEAGCLLKFNLYYFSDFENKYKLTIYDPSLDDRWTNPVPYHAKNFIDLLNIDLDWPYSYLRVRQYYPLRDFVESLIEKKIIQEWSDKMVVCRWEDISKSKIPGWQVYCFEGVKKVFVSDFINIYSFAENHSFPKGYGKGFFADIDNSFLVYQPTIESLVRLLVEDYAGKSTDLDVAILSIVRKLYDFSLFTFWTGF